MIIITIAPFLPQSCIAFRKKALRLDGRGDIDGIGPRNCEISNCITHGSEGVRLTSIFVLYYTRRADHRTAFRPIFVRSDALCETWIVNQSILA